MSQAELGAIPSLEVKSPWDVPVIVILPAIATRNKKKSLKLSVGLNKRKK